MLSLKRLPLTAGWVATTDGLRGYGLTPAGAVRNLLERWELECAWVPCKVLWHAPA